MRGRDCETLGYCWTVSCACSCGSRAIRFRAGRPERQSDPELDAGRGSLAVLLRQVAGLVREGGNRSQHRGRQGIGRLLAQGGIGRRAVRDCRSRDHAGGAQQGRRCGRADEHLCQHRSDLLLAEELWRERPEGFCRPQDRQSARRRLARDVAGLRQGRGPRAGFGFLRQCRADREVGGIEKPHRRYHQRLLQFARYQAEGIRQRSGLAELEGHRAQFLRQLADRQRRVPGKEPKTRPRISSASRRRPMPPASPSSSPA